MAGKTLQVPKERIKRLLSYPLGKQDGEAYIDLNMSSDEQRDKIAPTSANHYETRKLSEPAKLPNIHYADEKWNENLKSKKNSTTQMDQQHSPRHKSHSTNLPPLPSLHKHDAAFKYPLASKYFNKWQQKNRSSTSGMLTHIDIISEEGHKENSQTPRTAPLDLLSRFPSSPEFTSVLQSIFDNDKTSEE